MMMVLGTIGHTVQGRIMTAAVCTSLIEHGDSFQVEQTTRGINIYVDCQRAFDLKNIKRRIREDCEVTL